MDFFVVLVVILYIFIISKSYYLICKNKINIKELCFFGGYIFLVELVFEFFFYFIYLDGLGIEKFLFFLVLYLYFRFIKKYEKYRGVFLSLLLFFLYNSIYIFLFVILFFIIGDDIVL